MDAAQRRVDAAQRRVDAAERSRRRRGRWAAFEQRFAAVWMGNWFFKFALFTRTGGEVHKAAIISRTSLSCVVVMRVLG